MDNVDEICQESQHITYNEEMSYNYPYSSKPVCAASSWAGRDHNRLHLSRRLRKALIRAGRCFQTATERGLCRHEVHIGRALRSHR